MIGFAGSPSSSFCFSWYSSIPKPLVKRQARTDGLVDRALQLRLIRCIEFAGELIIGQGVAQVVRIRLETVLRSNTSSGSFILSYDDMSTESFRSE